MNLQGNFLDYIGAFLGGVVVSFSPCVYPLVPVVLGIIGAKGIGSHLKGFYLSLVYVFGLAVTYSVLGLIAALTGRLFGQISSHPLSFLVVGNICIIAGLSFLDVIPLNFPGIHLEGKVKHTGTYFSAFLLGLVSGLGVGSCTAPMLGVILNYVAIKQNLVYGASLLFVFACGVGFLLILVGAFSSVLVNLPKSGKWLMQIKKTCGFILIVIGEYFLIKAGRFM